MSYKQRVLRDNPVGFWSLDIPDPSIDSSPGIFTSGSRVRNNATIGADAISTGISPLVCGGNAAISLTSTSLSKITIPNNYNIFYSGTESKKFTIEFWLSLENLGKNNNIYKVPILSSSDTFSLYLLDNILTLEISDQSDSITKHLYLEIEDLDPQIHICLTYSERTYTLSVNGNNSSSIQLSKNYKFSNNSASNIIFSTYGESSSNKIIIDSIAFYNYELSISQKLDHMVWALSGKNAQAWTISNGGGYIDAKDEFATIENHVLFYSNETWSKGQFKNCYVDGGILSIRYIPPFTKYSLSGSHSTSLSSTNGLQTDVDSSLYIKNFNSYCNLNSDTISLDVKGTGIGSFFSIDGFEFGKLILRYNSDNKIQLYSPQDNSINLETASSVSGFKNVKINISNNGSVLNMLVGTESLSCPISKSSIVGSLDLYLGNSYITNSSGEVDVSPISGGLKNFQVLYSDSTWIKAELLTNYNISQYSEWVGQIIPTSTSNIVGSRIHYGSASKNVTYFISLQNSENETLWEEVTENGQQIPMVQLNTNQPLLYVKIKINTPDSSINRPNVNFLELSTYRSLFMNSRGFGFSLDPYSSNNYYSYNYRPNEFNVLARDTNIGIYFDNHTDGGKAIVTPSNSYEVIEFWFKVHSDPVADGKYYIFDLSAPTNASFYYDQNMNLNLGGSGILRGYLNGMEIANNETLIVDEIYHFVGILDSSSTSQIVFNGKRNYTSAGNTSIGMISLYPTSPFGSNDVLPLAQYKRYLGVNLYSSEDTQLFNLSESVNIHSATWAVIPGAVV